MENDLGKIAEILRGTALAERSLIELPVPLCADPAFAIEIAFDEMVAAWSLLRERTGETGRWPVVGVCWDDLGGGQWEDVVRAAELFSRWGYQQEPDTPEGTDISPGALVARAREVDVAAFLSGLAEEEEPIDDEWEYELTDTEKRLGVCPSHEDVANAVVDGRRPRTVVEFQRWLYEWEIAAVGVERALALENPDHEEWLDMQQPYALLLPPTPNSWDVLAFCHWYGAGAVGTAPMIALLRNWHERFGAELSGHLTTMLHFNVQRPPTDPAQIFQLAREQVAVAPCTTELPGVPLRMHARYLRNADRWFLHERP